MEKNILITGGAQGIGKIVTKYLIENNFNVSILEIDQEAIDEFRKEMPVHKNLFFCQCDVSSEIEVKKSIQDSADKFGRVDGLINNAAIHKSGPVENLSLDDWNRVMGVNLTGSFLCAKHAYPFLKKNGGSIVNLCSTRAFQSEPNTEAYSASKGGIFALTHSLAISLGPEIRVNCISPGWIDVSGIRKKSKASQTKLSESDHSQHPAGRVGDAGDIARMILFLLNPENNFITGQNFIVDGGMTRKMIYE